MAKSQHVPADVKKQILDRIKEGGVSISQIAEEHGISSRTIYGWLFQIQPLLPKEAATQGLAAKS